MVEAAEAAIEFVAGRDRADLDTDKMLRFALVRAVEVFGEAAAKMSEPQRHAASDLPWSRIVGMRNRLIHAYFSIDHDILWVTATREVPGLLPKLRALLEDK